MESQAGRMTYSTLWAEVEVDVDGAAEVVFDSDTLEGVLTADKVSTNKLDNPNL